MGKSILVNFAGAPDAALDASLRHSQHAMAASASHGGIDEVVLWNRERLVATRFYREHREILDQARGAGYWLWKPLIILEVLRGAGADDVVIYWDVGRTRPNIFTRSIAPLMRWCRQHSGMLPGVPILPQGQWTKRDCFRYMDCDEPRFWHAPQVQATFSLWSGKAAADFVSEWLSWCCDARCLTDAPNQCGLANREGFCEHRHDQSILTNLCVKYDVPPLEPLPLPRRGGWTKDINIFSEALACPGEDPAPQASVGAVDDAAQATTHPLTVHARRFLEAGEYADAEQICRAVLAESQLDQGALHLLGVIFMRTGRAAQGIDLLERVTRLPGADVAMIRVSLAHAFGSEDRAEIACRQALAADRTCIPAWLKLSRLLLEQGRHREARQSIRKALLLKPDDPELMSLVSCAPIPADSF